jgi:hypothetical protein
MISMIRRLRQAYHWRSAVRAHEQCRYDEAVATLRSSENIAPLTLVDHVLLANSLAGAGSHEAAASEYTACMKRSVEVGTKMSSFAFAYSAYMRASVTGDAESAKHFGEQLAALERPSAFNTFIKRDWTP